MFLDPYEAKALEYVVGIAFLILFAGFWHYVSGGAAARRTAARGRAGKPHQMFRVPGDVLVHPAHTWARLDAHGVAVVGIDDFAQRLVGPLEGFSAPPVGTPVAQGAPVIALNAGSKAVEVVTPVTGQVIAVNAEALRNPAAVNSDPYGSGWLMKVHVPQFSTCARQLLSANAARHLMASSWEELSSLFGPQLGTVMHDGGTPVDGLARAVNQRNWDAVARRFLRT